MVESYDDAYFSDSENKNSFRLGNVMKIVVIDMENETTRLSHKKLTCLSVEIKVSGESINLSIQA
jgi:hypothetical protein